MGAFTGGYGPYDDDDDGGLYGALVDFDGALLSISPRIFKSSSRSNLSRCEVSCAFLTAGKSKRGNIWGIVRFFNQAANVVLVTTKRLRGDKEGCWWFSKKEGHSRSLPLWACARPTRSAMTTKDSFIITAKKKQIYDRSTCFQHLVSRSRRRRANIFSPV